MSERKLANSFVHAVRPRLLALQLVSAGPLAALARQLLVGIRDDRNAQARSAAHDPERHPQVRAVHDDHRLASLGGSHDRAGDVIGRHRLLGDDSTGGSPLVLLVELVGAHIAWADHRGAYTAAG